MIIGGQPVGKPAPWAIASGTSMMTTLAAISGDQSAGASVGLASGEQGKAEAPLSGKTLLWTRTWLTAKLAEPSPGGPAATVGGITPQELLRKILGVVRRPPAVPFVVTQR
jgi:hypothetical protein